MKKISDIIGNEISWIQPDWRKNEFEIRDGEDLIGVISWERIGCLPLRSPQTAYGNSNAAVSFTSGSRFEPRGRIGTLQGFK